jgi:hypothetical protein
MTTNFTINHNALTVDAHPGMCAYFDISLLKGAPLTPPKYIVVVGADKKRRTFTCKADLRDRTHGIVGWTYEYLNRNGKTYSLILWND